MLSICIPIYNFDVQNLVYELLSQMDREFELILIDDASEIHFQEKNSNLKAEKIRYIQLKENVGRSKIRNLFLQYATKDYLLFLDCDAIIHQKDFLKKYTDYLTEDPLVICGGRLYPEELKEADRKLRWKYGLQFESKSVEERRKSPNSSFMTNNFVIQKSLFESFPFDERITQYGHEDTLYGIELEKQNISIQHIENPVINGDIETNADFLQKTRDGIKSLHQILAFYDDIQKLEEHITLLRVAKKLKRLGLKPFVKFCFGLTKKSLEKHLISSKNPSLKRFSFYKLGFFYQFR